MRQADLASLLNKSSSFVSRYEKGRRALSVVEFLEICEKINTDPHDLINRIIGSNSTSNRGFLDQAGISPEDFTKAVLKNPSLRGILIGYIAEEKFEERWLRDSRISNPYKNDDHNRAGKGDRVITYQGRQFIIEVKSLQTNSIKKIENGCYTAKAQVDASDKRIITLPNGDKVNTTCLLVGEFDVLGVNLFGIEGKWDYVFAKNQDLPRSTYGKYSPEQRLYLLSSLVPIKIPVQPPFSNDLFEILDSIINESP